MLTQCQVFIVMSSEYRHRWSVVSDVRGLWNSSCIQWQFAFSESPVVGVESLWHILFVGVKLVNFVSFRLL